MTKLNEQQIRAATHPKGNVLVLAGPGTGKTSTLTARFSYLVSKNISAESIFCVTFTKKAADEIAARLKGKTSSQCWIGTFHAHCKRLLSRFNEEAGLPRNFKIIDAGDQIKIIKKLGFDWNQEDGDITDRISRWKDALVSPDVAYAEASAKGSVTGKIAAEIFESYEAYIRKAGLLDFSDLITYVLKLFENSKTFNDFVAQRFKFILVDEFQDINIVQLKLIQHFIRNKASLWAVGDDDQALYSWRGSNVGYIVKFADYFESPTIYNLKFNYRSDPSIISAATALVINNKNRVKKELLSTKNHDKNNVVRIRGFENEKEEASWIATRIKLFLSKGASPKDISILLRTSASGVYIQQMLEKYNIPISFTGSLTFWDSPEVNTALSLFDAIENAKEKVGFQFKGGADFIDAMRGMGPNKSAAAVEDFLKPRPPANAASERVAQWADSIELICSIAKDFETYTALRDHCTKMTTLHENENSAGVSVTTIHSSKGLEYRHVFIPACEKGIIPHRKAEDIEEERRLFYVAITRSKGAVDITYCKTRSGKKQQPSAFIAEVNQAGAPYVSWHQKDEVALPTAIGSTTKTNVSQSPSNGPKIYYRKDGSKTLVPPEE